jgi:hypothetical protein
MKILKKLFAPKEVRAVLGILDEAECKFDSPAFEKIRKIIKNAILENTRNVIKQVREGHSPRQYVYSMIANVSGDYVESGQCHMYRGVLDPMGIGGELLKIFDAAVDELVLIGAVDKDFAQEQKKGIRENIKTVG